MHDTGETTPEPGAFEYRRLIEDSDQALSLYDIAGPARTALRFDPELSCGILHQHRITMGERFCTLKQVRRAKKLSSGMKAKIARLCQIAEDLSAGR